MLLFFLYVGAICTLFLWLACPSYAVVCDPPCENGACVSNNTCSCATGFEGEQCTEAGNISQSLWPGHSAWWLFIECKQEGNVGYLQRGYSYLIMRTGCKDQWINFLIGCICSILRMWSAKKPMWKWWKLHPVWLNCSVWVHPGFYWQILWRRWEQPANTLFCWLSVFLTISTVIFNCSRNNDNKALFLATNLYNLLYCAVLTHCGRPHGA